RGARERGVLEPGAVERHVLRDPIDYYVVSARLALNHFVDPYKLRGNVFAAGFLIHSLDKRRRKTLLLSKKYSDFFHRFAAVIWSEAGGEIEKLLESQTTARDVSTSLDMTQTSRVVDSH